MMFTPFRRLLRYKIDPAERIIAVITAWLGGFVMSFITSDKIKSEFVHGGVAHGIAALMTGLLNPAVDFWGFVIFVIDQFIFAGRIFWMRILVFFHLYAKVAPLLSSSTRTAPYIEVYAIASYLSLLLVLHLLVSFRGWLWAYLLLAMALLISSSGGFIWGSGIG